MAVGLHVIGVDVGHDRNHRRQEEEGRIRLVGLGDQEIALTEAGIGAGGIEAAADDEGRIDTAFGEDAGHQAGGGRLAVRAGDGDAAFESHQLGQHLRARHDRDFPFAGGDDFRIIRLDRRRDHDGIGAGDVLGGMADGDADALAFEAAGRGAGGEIGAADVEIEVGEDFGDAAHPGTADADEVNVLDLVFHLAISPQSAATSAVASGLARLRAFSAISCS